jgi:hypothetical protein
MNIPQWFERLEKEFPEMQGHGQKQVTLSNTKRSLGLYACWEQGWIDSRESILVAAAELPTDAGWWISEGSLSPKESIRRYLKFEYITTAGSDW